MKTIGFATISSADLSIVHGGENKPGQPPQPQMPPPQPPKPTMLQDAINIGTSTVDLATGAKSVRQTVNDAQSGWAKGRALPAKNGVERFFNGVGGATIGGFDLGW